MAKRPALPLDPIIEQLRAERLSREWILKDITDRTGLDVGQLERGRSRPNMATLQRWAGLLGFDLVLERRDA
jgi:transcriptional regulator with XRE-family HTH domain